MHRVDASSRVHTRTHTLHASNLASAISSTFTAVAALPAVGSEVHAAVPLEQPPPAAAHHCVAAAVPAAAAGLLPPAAAVPAAVPGCG